MNDERSTSLPVLASTMAALVAEGDVDVADVLARLVEGCAEVLAAQGVAILVVDAEQRLSLLTSSSHRADELEMLQVMGSRGPCVDCIESGYPVRLAGGAELVTRWGPIGRGMVERGLASVAAYPMRWHGRTFGGLNIFHETPPADLDERVAQAFADVATLVVVSSVAITPEDVQARLREALDARALVEQAKGVLAYAAGLDLDQAYDELRRHAEAGDATLASVARRVVTSRGSWPVQGTDDDAEDLPTR